MHLVRNLLNSNSNLKNISNYWRSQGFSVRASNVLAKTGIPDKATAIKKLTTYENILKLHNCGTRTADEIWNVIEEWRNEQNNEDDLAHYKNFSLQNLLFLCPAVAGTLYEKFMNNPG